MNPLIVHETEPQHSIRSTVCYLDHSSVSHDVDDALPKKDPGAKQQHKILCLKSTTVLFWSCNMLGILEWIHDALASRGTLEDLYNALLQLVKQQAEGHFFQYVTGALLGTNISLRPRVG